MPIYEFTCQACGQGFDKLCKLSYDLHEITCPACGATDPKKRISKFSYTGNESGKGSTSSCGGCATHNCGSCGH